MDVDDLLRKLRFEHSGSQRIPAVKNASTKEERIANFNAAVAEQESHKEGFGTTSDFHKKPESRSPSMDHLTPVNISDLQVGETHRGRVLFVRIATGVLLMKSAMVLVEDGEGQITDLAVYGLTNPNVLKEGRSLAIVEPFYKTRADNSLGIRVDNPSDLVFDVDIIPTNKAAKNIKTPQQRASVEERLQELLLDTKDVKSKQIHKKLLKEGYSVTGKQVRSLIATLLENQVKTSNNKAALVPILSERRPEKHRIIYSKTVLRFREDGNNAFEAKQYLRAEECYSNALNNRDGADGDNKGEHVYLWQLYGNQSAARMKLGKLDEALRDALASNRCAPADEVKPVLRCAEALAALGLQKEMKLLLESAKDIFLDKMDDLDSKKIALAPKEIIQVGSGNRFTSLAAAVRDAPAGAEIHIEPGIYRDPIVLTREVTIRGKNTTDFQAIDELEGSRSSRWAEISVANIHAILVAAPVTSPVRIVGCRVVCSGDPMMSLHALYATQGVAILRNCSLTSSSGPIVAAQNSETRLIAQSCTIHSGSQGGILVVDEATVMLDQVHCFGNAATGLELRTGGSGKVEGCQFYDNGRQGIVAWKSAGKLTAKNCDIHSNSMESGVLVSEAIVHLDACTICGNGSAGVVSQQKGDVSVVKCKVHDNCEGILIQDSGSATVEDCEVFSNRANGIFVGFSHRGEATLLNNSVHDNLSKGILVGNSEKVDVRGNVEKNNKGMPPSLPDFIHSQQKRAAFSSKLAKRLRKNKEKIATSYNKSQPNSFLDVLLQSNADECAEKMAEAAERILKECAFCRKLPPNGEEFQRCSRCKSVRYCSTTCQRSHWKQHKLNCEPKPVKYPAFVDHQQSV